MSERFATTQWSQVLAARDGSDTEARAALEWLCTAYWYPLYVFVRRSHDAEQAQDLTQSFFAHLLAHDILRTVDRSKGRFRSFLLASLKNHLSHRRDRSRALKRGGGTTTLSLDVEEAESRFRREPADERTPDRVFERRWALTVMERTMRRLQAEVEQGEGGDHFERLRPYLTGSRPRVPYREAGAALGLSEGAVKDRVFRMRRRFGMLLREEVAQTVADDGEVDAELRHLLTHVRS